MPKKIKSHKDLSIRWRKETCFYTLDLQPIGGTRQSFASKAEATIEAKRMFEIFETGKPATETKPWTVEKAVAEYLKHAKNRAEDPDARYGLKQLTTQRIHLTKCSALAVDGLAIAKRNVADLDVDFIEQDFWPTLKRSCNSSVTALNRFTAFRQMMFYCVKKKQIPSNPCSKAEIETPKRQEIWERQVDRGVAKVSPENLQRILDHVAPEHQLKVLFALETGLRISEQVAIKIFDPKRVAEGGIDFKKNTVHVTRALKMGETYSGSYIGEPKSKSGRRVIPVDPHLSQMLKEYYMALPVKMKTEGWLFPTTHGTRGDSSNWRERILYKACRKAGLERELWPTWHMLRHAYATTYLHKRGGNFDRAKELMGHSSYQTTLLYRHHVVDEERDRADAGAVHGTWEVRELPPEAPNDNSTVVPLKVKKAS